MADNTLTIAGNLTADPELRFTQSGAAVVNFTIACNERKYDRDAGEWVDAGTTFMRCSAWRGLAENIAESLGKGDRVIATGVIRQRDYETKDGDKRTSIDLTVDDLGASLKLATARPERVGRDSAPRNRRAEPARDDDDAPF